MIINLYRGFSKRENSTKRPSGTPSKVLTGYLRDDCSVDNPIFKIERLSADECPEYYTYAYIPVFTRYYFVTDWVWREGLWECHLRNDVLASWKTEIGNISAYISRCDSEFDGSIIDKLYPTKTNFDNVNVTVASGYNGVAPSGGCFVLGVICNPNFAGASQAGGAVTYYVMTIAQMRSLMNYLLSAGFLTSAGFPQTMTTTQQITQDMAKAFINPVQYIASCMWFPISATALTTSENPQQIVLGYWDMDSNVALGYKLDSFAYTESLSATIPEHPDAGTRGNYLNFSPYTRITLHLPPFGAIPLDTSYTSDGRYLHGTLYVDTITGKSTLQLQLSASSEASSTSDPVITEISSMFGVPIQITQMTPDYFQALTTVAKGVDAFIKSGDPGDLMRLDTLGNAIDNLFPQERNQGATGSFLETIIYPRLTIQHLRQVSENKSEVGRPLCAIRTINTLSGFIKCGEVSVEIPCFLSEKDSIHSFLMNGFFWE